MTAQDTPTLLDIALDALDHGFSVVPPKEDGTKRPDGPWTEYQQRLPTEDELRAWYANGRHGIGVVCGGVSGNLEMLEFEGRAVDADVHDEYATLAAQAGLTELVDRVFHGYCEWTPTGGLHLLFRVDGPAANNLKLARRPATDEELAEDADTRIKVLIETRGEGGYVIVAPSGGPIHPDGGGWRLTEGGFDHIATVTVEERDQLHRLARALDRMPSPPAPTDTPRLTVVQPGDVGQRPGDAYNSQPDAAQVTLQLLERHGWTRVFDRGHGDHQDVHLRRPGKPLGTSAVLHMDAGTLVVFSTSTRFEAEEAYTPFAVYTVLEHGGDYSSAARALRPASSSTADITALLTSPPTATTTGTGNDPAVTVSWQLPSPNIDAFLDTPEDEFDWLIPGLLERGDRIIVTASEGRGKSTFIRQIGVQAAAGIHPFTQDDMPPVRVVVLDLENSRRHVRRQLRPLRDLAGPALDPEHLTISVVPEGIDLMHDEGLLALDDLLARVAPELVVVGPLYKLATGDPKDEEQAQAVRRALDHHREKYGCAFLIEAHQPYATGGSSKRPLRPYGASLWSRWPEFGVALTGSPGEPTAELRHWRGARDERSWPAAVNHGAAGDWPWVIANNKAITFARMCEIARDHLAVEGDLPSVRQVSDRLAEMGVDNASKTTVDRAIRANQSEWDALRLEVG